MEQVEPIQKIDEAKKKKKKVMRAAILETKEILPTTQKDQSPIRHNEKTI